MKIAETQAKDVLPGQVAQIDTRNGIIPAHVIRIDPNVVNGTRMVECKLDGPLPPGAVPDLSVDGTVEIERLADVVYVGRPVFGQPNSQVSVFKLDRRRQRRHASHRQVGAQLGQHASKCWKV